MVLSKDDQYLFFGVKVTDSKLSLKIINVTNLNEIASKDLNSTRGEIKAMEISKDGNPSLENTNIFHH